MSMVRPASEEDLPRIAAIYSHWVEHTAVTFDLVAPSVAEWGERFAGAREGRYPWLVADAGGDVAGYATTAAFRSKPAYRSTVETTIYLEPTRVRHGLGRELYAALLDEAAARGFHLAAAGITLPNAASVGLHEALGFTSVGVFTEVGHKLGAWRDVGWWQRRLADRESAVAAAGRPAP